MSVKEEYEYLKTELMIRLSETTAACKLDCPFNFYFSKDEEDKYLPWGSMARLAVKRAFIILDNTYKKVRLYPTDEFIQYFQEAENDVYTEMKQNILDAGPEDRVFFQKCTEEELVEYTDELIKRIRNTLTPYIEELKKLTPEDVEREIRLKEKLKKAENTRIIQTKKGGSGLFD